MLGSHALLFVYEHLPYRAHPGTSFFPFINGESDAQSSLIHFLRRAFDPLSKIWQHNRTCQHRRHRLAAHVNPRVWLKAKVSMS
jgi:hypothetical protein